MRIAKKVFLLLFFLSSQAAIAQLSDYDLIKTIRNFEVKAVVSEITDEVVKYKRADNLLGPNYSLKIVDVQYIIYKNGARDDFNKSIVSQKPIATSLVSGKENDKPEPANAKEVQTTPQVVEPVQVQVETKKSKLYLNSPYVSNFKGTYSPSKFVITNP